MRTHAAIGARILGGSRIPLLQLAETVALTHHERWDGTGYPSGLRGETIPLSARIFAVADAFDAMTSDRPDSGAISFEAARREIVEETGHRADPREMNLVQSFMIESQYLATVHEQPIIASEVGYSAGLDSRLSIRIDPGEHDDYGWFTFGDACERIRWSDDREALERLQSDLATRPDQESAR